MNPSDPKYEEYALAREMLETPGVIRNFDCRQGTEAEVVIAQTQRLFLTGEASSRMFPAKHVIAQALRHGDALTVATDGARQAAEYDLAQWTVLGASNSGRSREVVELFQMLMSQGHSGLFSLSAFPDTPLGRASTGRAYVLACGREEAVAASKSVVEQALFYHALLDRLSGRKELSGQIGALADMSEQVLHQPIDPALVNTLAQAHVLHWAGRNDDTENTQISIPETEAENTARPENFEQALA